MQAIYDTDCSWDENHLGRTFRTTEEKEPTLSLLLSLSLSFFFLSFHRPACLPSFFFHLLPSPSEHGFESTFYGAINSLRRVAFLAPSRHGKGFANGKIRELPIGSRIEIEDKKKEIVTKKTAENVSTSRTIYDHCTRIIHDREPFWFITCLFTEFKPSVCFEEICFISQKFLYRIKTSSYFFPTFVKNLLYFSVIGT